MTAVVVPSEEECYLYAILTDPSGLDLAEFSWYDPERPDGCYRAWDFQASWYRCEDMYQADQGSRSVGKTVKITMRAFSFPFNFEGQRMLLTAPELNHLRPLTDAIESRLDATRLIREMRPPGKGGGISKQPHWQAKFTNGAQIISRLPNKDGKGVKSQHVIAIELDEAQDYPLKGWMEIVETLTRGIDGARWSVHGVPRGVRDYFYEITEGQNEDSEMQWTIHRPMAMNRPSWSPEERAEKTKTYGGSRQSIDYRRNIYGEHGDATNAVFVIAKLMACVDTDEGSKYNTDVYAHISIEHERLPHDVDDGMRQAAVISFINLPGEHFAGWSQKVGTREVGAPKGYSAYWGGMDVGVTNHPSEILLFGQRDGSDFLDLLLRVHMQRINTDDQKFVVGYLFERYGSKLKGFGIDKTGVGFPIWDQLSRDPKFGSRLHGFGFSEKRPVAFEDRPLERGETQKDLVIERNVVEAGTDWLRNDHVDAGKMRLPYDKEVLLEWQGQTYTTVSDTGNPYGTKRLFGGGSFHSLDAAKMVMAGMFIPPLEAILNQGPPQPPILDQFLGDS